MDDQLEFVVNVMVVDRRDPAIALVGAHRGSRPFLVQALTEVQLVVGVLHQVVKDMVLPGFKLDNCQSLRREFLGLV